MGSDEKKSVIRILDHQTGEWTVDFYIGKDIVPSFEVDINCVPIAKKYKGLCQIRDDIKLLQKWTKILFQKVEKFEEKNKEDQTYGVIDTPDLDYSDSLFMEFSAISILYGRLFAENTKRGISLNQKDHIEARLHPIHDELIRYRNKFIAHSSDESLEDSKVFLIINPLNNKEFIITNQSRIVRFVGSSVLKEVIELLENLLITIEQKISAKHTILEDYYRKEKLILKK